MTVETDDYLPISGLQHLLFCERQCALIHVEGVWAENRLTVEGQQLHERVDDACSDDPAGIRVARGLPLKCDRLRLSGKADVVEFRADGPYPVEYKRGRRKRWTHDEVQLCAQALCLEEMLGASIPRGAIYCGASRRRIEVLLDGPLRAQTEDAARRFHEMVRGLHVPVAVLQPKCRSCSLIASCMPGVRSSAVEYLHQLAESDRG